MLSSSNFFAYVCLFCELDVEPCQLYTKESKPDQVVSILLIVCCDFRTIIFIICRGYLCYFLLCSIDDVEGIESLRWEDQQRIRSYVEAGRPSNTKAATPTAMESAIEVSKTSRATCKHCSQKIMKGEVDFYV